MSGLRQPPLPLTTVAVTEGLEPGGAEAAPIVLDRVAKRYPGAPYPLDLTTQTIRLERGQFTALIGGSGAGKSTLLKLVNRLIEPDAGEVRFQGAPAAAIAGPELRRRIGYVFQGVGLFPHLSVAENITVTPRLLGWAPQRLAARVRELLDLVALPQSYAGRAPAQLSGGERQRVGVARALAAEPSVMLMDEPFGALDVVVRAALGAEYRALHERLNLTTLMVTHDVLEAALLADRILVLHHGRLIADAPPAALLRERGDRVVQALFATARTQAARVAAMAGEQA